tara:strand:+ start:661 stop:885 length:225 start_codon:yes stop_codon:yes gene_type:complete
MKTILAFMLITVIDGTTVDNADSMIFKNVHRCQQFAYWIEHNCRNPSCAGGTRQLNISAYCKPIMVREDRQFWD